MPRFSGKFEYHAAGGAPVEEAPCELSFDETTLTLVPRSGPPVAFDLGDIDVFETGEYEIRLVLYTGAAVRLKQFAKAFQDLARQLLEAYRDRLVRCLLASDLDEIARFEAHVRLEAAAAPFEGAAQVRLYESNLAVLPAASTGFQWRLSEIEPVELDAREYAVVLRRRGARLVVGRLAKRTGELVERLRDRVTVLEERAAHVLHALFPFVSPDQFREIASVMREGASVSIGALRPIHRLIEPSLLERVVDGALRPYLRSLVEQSAGADWHASFKIVRKDAEPEDGGPDDQAGDGPGGEADASVETGSPPDPAVTEVGEGLEVLYWFFFPLRAPAATTPSHLAWEATSRGGRATYVFRLPHEAPEASVAEAVVALNDGLVALNFRREPVYLPAATLECESRYRHYAIAARKVGEVSLVRQAFVGRAIHRSLSGWKGQLDSLLAR